MSGLPAAATAVATAAPHVPPHLPPPSGVTSAAALPGPAATSPGSSASPAVPLPSPPITSASGSRPVALHAVAPAGTETVRVSEACTACGACLATCPERALRRAPKRPSVVDAACTACWACIEICPAGAIVAASTSGGGAPAIPARPTAPGRSRNSGGRDPLDHHSPPGTVT